MPGVYTDKTDEVDIVYDLVGPYMEVIRKSIKDILPKIITSTFTKTVSCYVFSTSLIRRHASLGP